jgi:hypothetical protein
VVSHIYTRVWWPVSRWLRAQSNASVSDRAIERSSEIERKFKRLTTHITATRHTHRVYDTACTHTACRSQCCTMAHPLSHTAMMNVGPVRADGQPSPSLVTCTAGRPPPPPPPPPTTSRYHTTVSVKSRSISLVHLAQRNTLPPAANDAGECARVYARAHV